MILRCFAYKYTLSRDVSIMGASWKVRGQPLNLSMFTYALESTFLVSIIDNDFDFNF